MSDETPTAGMVDSWVRRYVEVRDERRILKRDYTAQDHPLAQEARELEGTILKHLNDTGAEGIRTKFGTCYKSERISASLADPSAFMDYVIGAERFELMDRKANATAVFDYIKENGAPPPGVNFNTMQIVGVQRAGATTDDE